MKLNRIKAILLKKGISQTWLAKKLDKSFSQRNTNCQKSSYLLSFLLKNERQMKDKQSASTNLILKSTLLFRYSNWDMITG